MRTTSHLVLMLLAPSVAAFMPSVRPLAPVVIHTSSHAPAVSEMKAAAVVATNSGLLRAVKGVATASAALSRPAKTGFAFMVAACVLLLLELKKRRDLIITGDACMLGNEGQCDVYDSTVESVPAWKLKLAQDALPNSNSLQQKLG